MQARACAYTAQAQTRDLRYIIIIIINMLIYQYGDGSYLNAVFHEYRNGYMHVSKDCSP